VIRATQWFLTGGLALTAAAFIIGAPAGAAAQSKPILGPPVEGALSKPVAGLRRFALVIGANDGGKGREILRFAGSDARAFSRVLTELGGAAVDDLEVLVEPSLAAVRAGFARIQSRMKAARIGGRRVEFIVYYSGHSDVDGLLLSGQKFAYADLRQEIREMPADVQIAILDSCASGAFTRAKGGKRLPAFLVDESHQVQGHAFLSSSSADEQAQESDQLGGSFFTHAFLGGLRGAADGNRDGRVTLSEAYQFAYNETIQRTQNTRYGIQHPGYEMHLVGTGDVILTDLRGTGAALVLGKDVSGRIFVRARSQELFLELTKYPDAPRLLGLPPDSYDIVVADGPRRHGARVVIKRGQRLALAMSDFRELQPDNTVARGSIAADGKPRRLAPIHFDFFRLPSADDEGHHVTGFNLLVGGGASLRGFELGGLANLRTQESKGVQIAGLANYVRGSSWIQVGGLANWTRGRVSGGQISGITSWGGGGVSGFQVGGIFNGSGGSLGGVQMAGIANFVPEDANGLQIGGIANHAGGRVRGVQLASLYNGAAQGVSGVQVSVVNYGAEVDGVQIGIVNLARRMRGVHLGLVNVATESNANSAPIGLFNYAPDGRLSFEAWVADVLPGRIGVKLGSRRVYALLAAASSANYRAAGAGLGVHFPARSFYIDVDVSSYNVWDEGWHESDRVDGMLEARAMVGIPLSLGFALFGGVSASGILSFDDEDTGERALDLAPFTAFEIGDEGDNFTMNIAPGFFAGLSY